MNKYSRGTIFQSNWTCQATFNEQKKEFTLFKAHWYETTDFSPFSIFIQHIQTYGHKITHNNNNMGPG